MNEDHHACEFDHLDPPLKAAVEAVLAEPLPKNAVQRVTEGARRVSVASPTGRVVANLSRRRRFPRALIGAVAAASALALLCIFSMSQGNSTNAAFARMIDKLRTADTVQFRAVIQFGNDTASENRVYSDGTRARSEDVGGVWASITKLESARILVLDRKHKRYQWNHLSERPSGNNLIDILRGLKSKEARLTGEEIINGRRAQVFQVDYTVDFLRLGGDLKTATMVVWTDMRSELPARVVVRDLNPNRRIEVRFDDFVWNEPLDPQLLSLEIPAGFTPIDDKTPAGPIEAEQAQPAAAQALP
jgi:outer membrane lipoprotein-sorting protein